MERCARAVVLAGAVTATLLAPEPATAQTCSLRVVWLEPSGGPSPIAEAMRESARILRSPGTELAFTAAPAGRVLEPFETAVVLLPSRLYPRQGPARVLGATQPEAASAVWAFPDAVAATVGLPPDPRTWTGEQTTRLGRALGRVVAHEIFHLVTGRARHDGAGLMAASFSRPALASEAFVTDASTRQEWQRALRGRCRPAGGAAWTSADP